MRGRWRDKPELTAVSRGAYSAVQQYSIVVQHCTTILYNIEQYLGKHWGGGVVWWRNKLELTSLPTVGHEQGVRHLAL